MSDAKRYCNRILAAALIIDTALGFGDSIQLRQFWAFATVCQRDPTNAVPLSENACFLNDAHESKLNEYVTKKLIIETLLIAFISVI